VKPRLAGRLETRLALQRTAGCAVYTDGKTCGKAATRAYTRGGMAHAACEACLVRLGVVRAPEEPSGQGGLL
jgi:hypothetical protein